MNRNRCLKTVITCFLLSFLGENILISPFKGHAQTVINIGFDYWVHVTLCKF